MTAVVALTPSHRTVLRMIEAAADAGRTCPSNAEIADRCGFASVATSVRVIDALQDGGWITVTRFQAGREVTVMATGRTTHWPHARTPHWRETARVAVASEAPRASSPKRIAGAASAEGSTDDVASRGPVRHPPLAGLVRIDRDPCFRCGVRADIGCVHQPASLAEIAA